MPLDLASTTAIAATALVIEGVAGYPQALFRRAGHPVVAIGMLIGLLDRRLNRETDSTAMRRIAGVLAVLALLGAAVGVAVILAWPLRQLTGGWLVEAVLASTLLAQRSLHQHVAAVGNALTLEGLPAGRRAVSMIVGRNPQDLDASAVSRAAIESLAENFSDGVVSPLLWLAVGGLPGIVFYKAVNTADSMIGHLSSRHAAFGWAAARLDDGLNLPGARLSALLIALAALTCRGWRGASASLTAVVRDAGKHRSPNAGWPEAAMAGALGVRLGGPRQYGALAVEGAWLGDGRAAVDSADIGAALTIFRRACVLLLLLAAVAWRLCI